jgi:hypothetical protein
MARQQPALCDRGNPCASQRRACPQGKEVGALGKRVGRQHGALACMVTLMAVMAEFQAHDVERPGERLQLHVDMNRVVLIDPQTELVL